MEHSPATRNVKFIDPEDNGKFVVRGLVKPRSMVAYSKCAMHVGAVAVSWPFNTDE